MRFHRTWTLVCMLACLGMPVRAAAQAGAVLPLPAADQKVLDAQLGVGVVGAALPSAPITDASVYFPLRERTLTYRVTAGPLAGTTQKLQVTKGQRPNGTPAWRVALSPSIAAFIRPTQNGDLMMAALSDSGEGLIVVPTPANPFLLQGMQPGETRTLSQAVSVNYLDDPTDQDYSGTMTTESTYVGTYQVTVPAGTYNAILMRTAFKGKIGPADTTDTGYHLFAAGVGLVAMVRQEDVEAFWIVHIDTTSGKVLVSE